MPTPSPFIAAPAVAPLTGTCRVPGDKSISHRALIIGALAWGETRIEGLLESEDVLHTADALTCLGADIHRVAGQWLIHGRGLGGLTEPSDVLNLGNSGTSARLLAGVLASHRFTSFMTGDASLRRRPMRRVTEPLSLAGARFACRDGGRLPLAIEGTGDAVPIQYQMPIPSAQVKSAILLAGLNARGETVIDEDIATRDHTERMLAHFGVSIASVPRGIGATVRLIGGQTLTAANVNVPGDISSAAFPIVAALCVPGSAITIDGVGINPLRTGLLSTLNEMGASIHVSGERRDAGEAVASLSATFTRLTATDVPHQRIPSMVDEIPVLAVAAACAHGRTRLRGLGELRVKESDRLTATARLLSSNGVQVTLEGDDLLIDGAAGPPTGGGHVTTNMDHRLAMSGAILGLVSRQPVSVDDMSFVATSFPGFVTTMARLGAAWMSAA